MTHNLESRLRQSVQPPTIDDLGDNLLSSGQQVTLQQAIDWFDSKFYPLLPKNKLIHYDAGPVDDAEVFTLEHARQRQQTKLGGNLFTIDPTAQILGIWEKSGWPTYDLMQPATQLFLVDYSQLIFLLSSDVASFRFIGLTVGTGFEFYIALSSKLGLIFPDWNPEIYLTGELNDPLFQQLDTLMDSHPELEGLVHMYSNKERMYEAIKNAEDEMGSRERLNIRRVS